MIALRTNRIPMTAVITGPGSSPLAAKLSTKQSKAANPNAKFCARSFILERSRHAIVRLRFG
jgi:hypothetical protein